jgi:hypothetical protein
MEPESKSPHSYVPATCLYREQARAISIPIFQFLKICLFIIPPSKPGSLKWTLSLRISDQLTVYASPASHTHYMTRPSHSFQV